MADFFVNKHVDELILNTEVCVKRYSLYMYFVVQVTNCPRDKECINKHLPNIALNYSRPLHVSDNTLWTPLVEQDSFLGEVCGPLGPCRIT